MQVRAKIILSVRQVSHYRHELFSPDRLYSITNKHKITEMETVLNKNWDDKILHFKRNYFFFYTCLFFFRLGLNNSPC